jgi:hypothetical protein
MSQSQSRAEPHEETVDHCDPHAPVATSNSAVGVVRARQEPEGGELPAVTVSRTAPEDKSESGEETDSTGQGIAIAGLGVGLVGVIFTVLAVAVPVVAVVGLIGVVVGLTGGVLLTPTVRRGAHWLDQYLR